MATFYLRECSVEALEALRAEYWRRVEKARTPAVKAKRRQRIVDVEAEIARRRQPQERQANP